MKVEEENQLPFLNVLVKKRKDSTLAHIVYREGTHTNRRITPPQLKSVVKALVTRLLEIRDREHITKETKTIY